MTGRYTGGIISATTPTPTPSSASGIWTVKEAEYYQKAGLWPDGSGSDPYFKYTTLLLHGDGTNGAQNNTFVDSSSNNFSITRNGGNPGMTQGSYNPYIGPGCWSAYFNGSSGVSFPNTTQSAINVGATSNFTIQCWVYLSAISGTQPIIADNTLGGAAYYWLWSINSSGYLNFYWYTGAANNCTATTTALTANSWNHIAMSVSSGVIKFFVNGILQTLTGTTTLTNPSGNVGTMAFGMVGTGPSSFMTGYMSNIRVSNIAEYTAAFTPPTTALTATANTTLLTFNTNRFLDSSSSARVASFSSTPSISRFSNFSPLVVYSSNYGGSAYFDGTGDYLSNTTANLTASGNFTLEYWLYNLSTVVNSPASFSIGNEATGRINFFITASAIQYNIYGGSNTSIGTYSFLPGIWYHIAIVRSGTTLTAYVNGVSAGAVTLSGTLGNATGFYINGTSAAANASNAFYLGNMRYVNGSAVYTGTFTPPTTPVTAIASTQLLLNFTNGGVIDNTMLSDTDTIGNAQINTSIVKYGTGSMYFNGASGSSIKVTSNSALALGSGDWTIECWVYYAAIGGAGNGTLYEQRDGSATAVPLIYLSGSTLIYYTGGAARITGGTMSTGQWYHIAVCRASGSTRMFVNGTQVGSTYADATNYVQTPVYLGSDYLTTGNLLNGYIDDLRVTKGYARYTANFTPPGSAFPNY